MASAGQRRNTVTLVIELVLLVGIGLVNSATPVGKVTLFTFYSVVGPSTSLAYQKLPIGSTATFRCRVEYNGTRTPTVYLRKVINRVSWELATNEDVNANDLPSVVTDRVAATIIDNDPNGADVYQWSITSLTPSDTANYTCYVGTGVNTSNASISLDITVEPSALSLYVNNELQNQSMDAAVYKKPFVIGQVYNVTCKASGGNPYPNVSIYSGSQLLTPISTTYNMGVSSTDVNGVVTRSTMVSVNFTMNLSSIGVPLVCYAGVVNSRAISYAVNPFSESVVPHFKCQDQFFYQAKQSTLALNCTFIGSNVTSYVVRWSNANANVTLTGTKGLDNQLKGDSRYSLRVSPPLGNEVWSNMILTINNPSSVTDLATNRYFFVVASNLGQAVHEVRVKPDDLKQDSDRSAGVHLSSPAFGSLIMFVMVSMASVFGQL